MASLEKGMLSVCVQDTLAVTLVDNKLFLLDGWESWGPSMADVLLDAGASPEVSMLLLRA